ncbi:MAG: NUDIX hydrolase [Caldilineaceae bacterium]
MASITDGEILLEREYRHGVGEVIWQLPGGLAEPDEDFITAGLRELLEETGHAPQVVNADTVRYLGSVWDNPGLGKSVSHLRPPGGWWMWAASAATPPNL